MNGKRFGINLGIKIAGTPPESLSLREEGDKAFERSRAAAQSKLEGLIDRRGWRELGFVRKGNYFLTPGPLDFLAHHGPSFVTEAIPWLQERLESAERRL